MVFPAYVLDRFTHNLMQYIEVNVRKAPQIQT